jgi:hypothetical protein
VDYEETLLQLDSIVGTWAIVYPAEESDEGDEPRAFVTGMWVAGRFGLCAE